MATTFDQIAKFLQKDKVQFTYSEFEGTEYLEVTYETTNYRNPQGERQITVLIRFASGPGLYMCVPGAFEVGEGNLGAAAVAACLIQWRTDYVQFEFDDASSEIRPCVEIPIYDAKLSQQQVVACLDALLFAVEDYAAVLGHACKEGVIDFELFDKEDGADAPSAQLASMLAQFTPEQIQAAVAARGKK